MGPEIGGTLAVAGKYGVELLARADGTVEAIVHDAAGALVTGDAGAKIEAKLNGADGKAHAVALAFDAAKARFVGKVDAGVKLAAGPVDITVNGEAGARLPQLALVAEAKHGGKVLVAGDFSVELVADGNLVSAFVFDASGAAAAKGDLDLAVRLGSGAFVNLAWDAPSASYRAKLDAKVSFDVEPITVAVKAGARAFVGASIPSPSVKLDAKAGANANVDAKAAADANAKVGAKADIKVPTPTANVTVKAPTANVNVQAPKVNVGTGGAAKTGASATAGAGFNLGTK